MRSPGGPRSRYCVRLSLARSVAFWPWTVIHSKLPSIRRLSSRALLGLFRPPLASDHELHWGANQCEEGGDSKKQQREGEGIDPRMFWLTRSTFALLSFFVVAFPCGRQFTCFVKIRELPGFGSGRRHSRISPDTEGAPRGPGSILTTRWRDS